MATTELVHTPISGREKLRRLRQFTRIGGSRSVTTAKVIAIGERHSEQQHPELIGHFIKAFAREGDIVLLEGVVRGKEVFKGQSSTHERYQLPERVRVIGWDDLALHAESVRMYKEAGRLHDEMVEAAEAKDYVRFDEVNARRKALSETTEDIAVRKRNLSLIETLREARPIHNRRIFIIAGRSHLTDDPHLTEVLQETPHVLLKPDTPEPTREESYRRARHHIEGM